MINGLEKTGYVVHVWQEGVWDMQGKWIFGFDELGQEHSDLVGKKCANLGELTKIGVPVPGGFALSVEGTS